MDFKIKFLGQFKVKIYKILKYFLEPYLDENTTPWLLIQNDDRIKDAFHL